MRSTLLLCRHGNTFEAHQRAYMVGVHEDIPLTSRGRQQASEVADCVKRSLQAGNLEPMPHIWCGPLQRTKIYAEILASELTIDRPVLVDSRLTEIDYGKWSGCTHEELALGEDAAELAAWEGEGIWPPSAGFNPPLEQVLLEVEEFLEEATKQDGLNFAVTSNGRLRMMWRLLNARSAAGESPGAGKVGTGGCCVVVRRGENLDIVAWNVRDAELVRALK